MSLRNIPFDYHSHNYRCGHAVGTLADYIEAGHSLGYTEFGLSDHNPAWFAEGDQPTRIRTYYLSDDAIQAIVQTAVSVRANPSGPTDPRVYPGAATPAAGVATAGSWGPASPHQAVNFAGQDAGSWAQRTDPPNSVGQDPVGPSHRRHGHARRARRSPTYQSWRAVKQRCDGAGAFG